MKNTIRLLALLTACFSLSSLAKAQEPNKVTGVWLTQDKDSKIEIKQSARSTFEGKIIWLKEPNEENGTPKVDDENPDVKLQSRPILGLKLLNGFVYNKDDQEWTDGTIYDPKSGSTYKCYMWFEEDPDVLFVKGYIGVSIIGKKVTWTRVK